MAKFSLSILRRLSSIITRNYPLLCIKILRCLTLTAITRNNPLYCVSKFFVVLLSTNNCFVNLKLVFSKFHWHFIKNRRELIRDNGLKFNKHLKHFDGLLTWLRQHNYFTCFTRYVPVRWYASYTIRKQSELRSPIWRDWYLCIPSSWWRLYIPLCSIHFQLK